MSETSQRNSNEETIHTLMVRLLVEFYERLGFDVKANHLGGFRETPDPIGSQIPDLVVKKGDDIRVIEVETKDTVDTEKTRQQLREFTSKQHKLVLAVPYECLQSAMELRENLAIDFEILPCYPMVRYVGVAR